MSIGFCIGGLGKFAGPRVNCNLFGRGAQARRFAIGPRCAAVRRAGQSRAPTVFCGCGNRVAVIRELEEGVVLRVWYWVCVLGNY